LFAFPLICAFREDSVRPTGTIINDDVVGVHSFLKLYFIAVLARIDERPLRQIEEFRFNHRADDFPDSRPVGITSASRKQCGAARKRFWRVRLKDCSARSEHEHSLSV
jgi:hypothetical protein